jgi:hypothetical protein
MNLSVKIIRCRLFSFIVRFLPIVYFGYKARVLFGVLLTGLLLTTQELSAQDNIDPKTMVGFGCYYEGRQSRPVEKVTRLLQRGNSNAIKKLLGSSNSAEQFLAVIVLERLSELGRYSLNHADLVLIGEIKKSNRPVSIYSGCTYFDTIPLQRIFESDELILFSRDWLNKNINMP